MSARSRKTTRRSSYLDIRLKELYEERERGLFNESGLPESWVDSYKSNLDFEIYSIEDYLSIKKRSKQLKVIAYILLTAFISAILLLLLL